MANVLHQTPSFLPIVTFKTVDEAISACNIGTLISKSDEDTANLQTTFVTSMGTYVLKRYPKSLDIPSEYVSKVLREMLYVEKLRSSGIDVPEYVNFQPFVLNSQLHLILKKVATKVISVINEVQARNLGVYIAKIHETSLQLATSELRIEHRHDYTTAIRENMGRLKPLSESIVQEHLTKFSDTRDVIQHFTPAAIIPVETSNRNLQLIVGTDTFQMVDFELAKKLPLVFDFLPILGTFFTSNGEFKKPEWESFISGYKTIRGTEEYKSQFVTAYEYHLLSKINYSLARAIDDPEYRAIAQGRIKSYENNMNQARFAQEVM